jgi:hypothetical protein
MSNVVMAKAGASGRPAETFRPEVPAHRRDDMAPHIPRGYWFAALGLVAAWP